MPSRSHSRRQTLRLGGALTLVFAGGRLQTANAEGQILPEGDAYAPWGLWNDPSLRGAPLALVAAAVLAANPHDTQPWLFRISDDAIEVLADLSRNLGAMDAFVREMHLGLGCAIEDRTAMTPRSRRSRARSRTSPSDAVPLRRPQSA